MSDDLVAFLRARYDEEAAEARAAADELGGLSLGGQWRYDGRSVEACREHDLVAVGSQDFMEPGIGQHIARHNPARVLADIDAKRRLLYQFVHRGNSVRATAGLWDGGVWDDMLRLLALPYADHPDYREEWKP